MTHRYAVSGVWVGLTPLPRSKWLPLHEVQKHCFRVDYISWKCTTMSYDYF